MSQTLSTLTVYRKGLAVTTTLALLIAGVVSGVKPPYPRLGIVVVLGLSLFYLLIASLVSFRRSFESQAPYTSSSTAFESATWTKIMAVGYAGAASFFGTMLLLVLYTVQDTVHLAGVVGTMAALLLLSHGSSIGLWRNGWRFIEFFDESLEDVLKYP